MKIRTVTATIHHAESNWKEEKTVTALFTDDNEKYELTKVFVVEFNKQVIFSTTDNTFLLPD
jgi:hypothetical protein